MFSLIRYKIRYSSECFIADRFPFQKFLIKVVKNSVGFLHSTNCPIDGIVLICLLHSLLWMQIHYCFYL